MNLPGSEPTRRRLAGARPSRHRRRGRPESGPPPFDTCRRTLRRSCRRRTSRPACGSRQRQGGDRQLRKQSNRPPTIAPENPGGCCRGESRYGKGPVAKIGSDRSTDRTAARARETSPRRVEPFPASVRGPRAAGRNGSSRFDAVGPSGRQSPRRRSIGRPRLDSRETRRRRGP